MYLDEITPEELAEVEDVLAEVTEYTWEDQILAYIDGVERGEVVPEFGMRESIIF